MMNRKTVALSIVAVLALAGGCGDADKTRVIGISIQTSQNPFFVELGEAAAAEAARHGYTAEIVSGDGEFLMNVSSLATIGHMRPSNLAMLCIDNGRYGETGNQESHTYRTADLAAIAHGSGIDITMTVRSEDQFEQAARALRSESGPSFVVLRVNDGAPADYARNFDAVETKANFRRALLAGY